MKKLIALLLVLVMAVSLVACANNASLRARPTLSGRPLRLVPLMPVRLPVTT